MDLKGVYSLKNVHAMTTNNRNYNSPTRLVDKIVGITLNGKYASV
jgi:hypothetical protein